MADDTPTTASECSSQDGEGPQATGPDLNDAQALKQLVEDNCQPISVERAVYDKPVAVIYNPASGRK